MIALVQEMRAQMAAQSATIQQLVEDKTPKAKTSDADLPDSAEFLDAKGRLKPEHAVPVLTKQGWLVPSTFGAPPESAKR